MARFENIPFDFIDEGGYDGFLGMGKRAKARKADNHNVKIEKKKATAENRRSKAQSRILLAEQGIVQPGGFGEAISGITSLASAVTGGGASEAAAAAPAPLPEAVAAPVIPALTAAPPASTTGTVASTMGGAIQTIKSVFGGGDSAPYTPTYYPEDEGSESTPPPRVRRTGGRGASRSSTDGGNDAGGSKEKEKNKNMPFIIGGAVLAVILILVMVMKKS